jgi:hypothetical protein
MEVFVLILIVAFLLYIKSAINAKFDRLEYRVEENLDKKFKELYKKIADLKANEKYTITTGNSELNSPEYDLENFKNSMDNNLPKAKIYEIKHLDSQKAILKNESIWQQPWFMWLCIGFGGIIVAFFTRSLINDVKKIT